MESLLGVRSVVLTLLERARGDKNLKSALEAKVTITLPSDTNTELVQLLKREASFLKTLFIVSDVELLDAGSCGPASALWSYSETMKIPGTPDAALIVRVVPATLGKCPRCWTYTRPEHKELCARCQDVVKL